MRFRLCDHAKEEAARRGIPGALLDSVLQSPQQVVAEKKRPEGISIETRLR